MLYVKYFFITMMLFVGMSYPGICEADIVDMTHVDNTVQKVLQDFHIPEIKPYQHQYRLLLIETSVVESEGTALSCMGNYGHYQIRGTTGKDLLAELKSGRPDIYSIVMKYHNANKSLKDNLLSNLSFSTALCLAYYCTKIKDPAKQLSTLEQRAATWKKLYNTYRGAGSTSGYIRKARPYHDRYVKPLFAEKGCNVR